MNLLSAARQLGLLRHALGMDGQSHRNRNLYKAHMGTPEYLACCQMVDWGYMRSFPRGLEKGSYKFAATDRGRRAASVVATPILMEDWLQKGGDPLGVPFCIEGNWVQANGEPASVVTCDGEAYTSTPEQDEAVPF